MESEKLPSQPRQHDGTDNEFVYDREGAPKQGSLEERLRLPVSESMFVRKSGMLRALFAERTEAADELARLKRANASLRAGLERADVLVSLLTVRQVIEAGDRAIDAAGINPWLMNEGLAAGNEHISPSFMNSAIASIREADHA